MENLWTKIESYFNGELNAQQKKEMEEQLKTDENLANEFNLYKDIEGGIRLKGNELLRQQLERIEKKVLDTNQQATTATVRRLPTLRILAIAASIALLFGVVYFLTQPAQGPVEYAAYFEPFELDTATRGATNTSLESIYQLYNKKEYQAFIQEVEKRVPDSERKMPMIMALGTAYKLQSNYSEAISYFNRARTNPLYKETASWNITIMQLENGDLGKAKTGLDSLVAKKRGPYFKLAQKLLKQIQ